MATRIKICGLTRAADVDAAVHAGADALGFNFVPTSPRCIDLATATQLAARIPAFVTSVALFVDPHEAQVRAVIAALRPQLLQFHGREDDVFAASFGLPYIKAIRVDAPVDGELIAARYPTAIGVLLDAAVAGRTGGTGQRFDLAWYPHAPAKPWILAGGLSADNVVAAMQRVRPYAVDVSSGVESAPGVKDAARIAAFCRSVQSFDRGAA